MMHGPAGAGGRFGGMLNQETIKPRNLGETLGRLGGYFNRFWYMILLAVGFVVVATWTQVTTPELMGQATDCFLVPTGASTEGFASFFPQAGSQTQASSSCYLATDDTSSLSFTRRLIYNAYTLGGFDVPNPATMTSGQRIEGMFRFILVMIGLYVLGAVLTGLTFFTMAWTGQHVLRVLRVEVFEQLHRLSLSYYSQHEAGDLMSRITNDTDRKSVV